jgi:hypothetical protein
MHSRPVLEVLHEPRVVALPGGEQEQGIGQAQREHQQRHTVVALAARTVDGTAQRDGGAYEKHQLARNRHPEGGGAGYEMGGTGRHPQHAEHAQRLSFEGIDAGPVRTCGEQEAHRDGGDEAPEHLVRVPDHTGQLPAQHDGGEHPQRHRYGGPEAAGQVQRPEAQFQKCRPLRRWEFHPPRLLDLQQLSHGTQSQASAVGTASGSRLIW